MKKWQLEGVLCRIASPKLILPDLDHTVCDSYVPYSCSRKESRVVSVCRSIVAFFIRFF
jgi:hypothetical protein